MARGENNPQEFEVDLTLGTPIEPSYPSSDKARRPKGTKVNRGSVHGSNEFYPMDQHRPDMNDLINHQKIRLGKLPNVDMNDPTYGDILPYLAEELTPDNRSWLQKWAMEFLMDDTFISEAGSQGERDHKMRILRNLQEVVSSAAIIAYRLGMGDLADMYLFKLKNISAELDRLTPARGQDSSSEYCYSEEEEEDHCASLKGGAKPKSHPQARAMASTIKTTGPKETLEAAKSGGSQPKRKRATAEDDEAADASPAAKKVRSKKADNIKAPGTMIFFENELDIKPRGRKICFASEKGVKSRGNKSAFGSDNIVYIRQTRMAEVAQPPQAVRVNPKRSCRGKSSVPSG